MRVIKNNSKKIIICNNCDSILEYDYKDIENINGVKNIHCPICDTYIKISQKKKNKKSKDSDKKFLEKILNCEDTDCNDVKYITVNLEPLRNVNYLQEGKK